EGADTAAGADLDRGARVHRGGEHAHQRAGPRQHGRGAELVAALPGAGEDTAVGEEARLVDEFLTVGPAGHLSRRHLRILSVHRAIWRSYDSPRACEPRRPCDAIMTA